jgi:outer membrane protein assembly factor BamB
VRQSRVIGVTLLTVAAVVVSVAAQVPPAGSGARMPPESGGQTPTTAEPGRQGRGEHGEPRKPGQEKVDKNKPPEKFGPISVLPLQQFYFASLGAPPAFEPIVDGPRFYMAMKNKTIGAWSALTGTAWVTPEIGAIQAIAVDSGRVYATLEEEVAAFDSATGKALWRLPSGGALTAAPPVAKGGWVLVALESGELHALRGETGEVVWKVKLDAAVKTRPVIVGDRVYVAPQNNQLIAIDLLSGQKLWDQDFDSPVTAIAAQDQRVFVGTSRMFFAFDHAGHKKWDRRVGSAVVGQLVVDDQSVYAVFTDNTLMAFGANKGDLRWRTPLAYRPASGPERADDTLLLTGTALIVHGYSVKDGKAFPDFLVPADPQRFFIGVKFVRGPTFFQDTVIAFFAHGWIAASQRVGPNFYSPFTDLGVVCPPLAMPGEQPPPTTAAVPVPPKL